MQKIRAPETFLKTHDHRLIWVTAMIAFVFVIPIPNLFMPGAESLNSFWLRTLPLAATSLCLFVPVALYYGILLNQQSKYHDFQKEAQRLERTKLGGKLSYRAYLQSHLDGTSWEIFNTNHFDWHDTKVLIERTENHRTFCEKRAIGEVARGCSVRFDSSLRDSELTRWRIMVLTREGSLTEFPDNWSQERPGQVRARIAEKEGIESEMNRLNSETELAGV